MKKPAILLKFECEVFDKKDFDSLSAEMQDNMLHSAHTFDSWDRLKPLWDIVMDIIEDNCLDTRCKGREAEIMRGVKNSIRFSSHVCLVNVTEFIEWYYQNKEILK